MIADERRSIIWWGWVGDHLDDIWQRTIEHVQLTIIAMLVGCVISFALALLAVRVRWTYRPDHESGLDPLHDPEHRLVRAPHPVHRPRHPHRRDRAGQLHDPDPRRQHRGGSRRRARVGQGSRRRHGLHTLAPAPHGRDPTRPADDHRRHPRRGGDRDRARDDRRADRHRWVRRTDQRRAPPQLPDPDRDRRHPVDLSGAARRRWSRDRRNVSSLRGGADT